MTLDLIDKIMYSRSREEFGGKSRHGMSGFFFCRQRKCIPGHVDAGRARNLHCTAAGKEKGVSSEHDYHHPLGEVADSRRLNIQ
jgi:hypothetical protein